MKYYTLVFIIIISFSQNLFSQTNESITIKHAPKDWETTINISGLIQQIQLNTSTDLIGNPMFYIKRHLDDGKAFRIGVGVNNNRLKQFTADSIGQTLVEIDSLYRNLAFSLNVGIEKHFKGTKRLAPFIGGELALGSLGKTKIDAKTTISEDAGVSTEKLVIINDGGIAIGIHGFVGFDYFIAKKISLGASYNIGYQTQMIGGDFNKTIVSTPLNGASNSSFIKQKSSSTKSGFFIDKTINILLSIHF